MAYSNAVALADRADVRISAAVRGLIAQRGMKREQVALAIGLGRSTFYNRLNNVSAWEADEVERIAGYFGVSRDSLFEGRADYPKAPGSVTGAFGARSSTDRASDYGSVFGRSRFHQAPSRTSERRRRIGALPLYLRAVDGADEAVPA